MVDMNNFYRTWCGGGGGGDDEVWQGPHKPFNL